MTITITIFRGVSKEEAVTLVASKPGKRKGETPLGFFERTKRTLAANRSVIERVHSLASHGK